MTAPRWLRETKEGLTLAVQAQPNAKVSQVVGEHGEALKIKIASPPVDGAANAALTSFLAARLGLKARDVELLRGASGRQKVFLIRGISLDDASRRLRPSISQD